MANISGDFKKEESLNVLIRIKLIREHLDKEKGFLENK